mgnify:CR=1 FL=1
MVDYEDYRDSRKADNDERVKAIKEIEKRYDVSTVRGGKAWGEITNAAGVGWIEDPWTYLFFARCVAQARDMKEDYGEDWEDYVGEAADSCVPHQTFVLWSIWIDCGYEDDYLEDMGYEPELGELYKIPQIQLLGYAERIIYTFGPSFARDE